MNESTESRRVLRAELDSPTTSADASDDDSVQRLLQSHLRQTFDGLDAIPAPAVVTEPPIKREDSENEAAFDFRLFLRPSQAQIQTNGLDLSGRSQKVVIRSPTPDVREPGFLVPHKAETAYLTKDRTARQAEQFRRAAVTGEDIITRANQHCPGCELPWRVTTIKSSGRQNFAHESAPSEVQATRRKRAGKKRRIAIRKKDALKKKQRETEARLRAEKEAAEKEKRTRRNREKKVKRKAKEKSKKTGDVELDTSRQSDKT